jgi:hypothetical protein
MPQSCSICRLSCSYSRLSNSRTFPQPSHVDVVARTVAFVKVAIAAQVEQIELVDQPVAFQQVDGAIDGDAGDAWVQLLRPFEDFSGVQVPPRGFHHLEQHAALARQPDAAGFELLLEVTGRFMGVDAFAARNAMRRCRAHPSLGSSLLRPSGSEGASERHNT